MGVKTTRYINRETAVNLLLAELPVMRNDVLADILDLIADNDSAFLSRFDNFIIREEN